MLKKTSKQASNRVWCNLEIEYTSPNRSIFSCCHAAGPKRRAGIRVYTTYYTYYCSMSSVLTGGIQ